MVGSLSLYTTLIAMCFTLVCRRAALTFMAAVCMYSPDLFYSGASFFMGVLTDISLFLEDSLSWSEALRIGRQRLRKAVEIG